jgi:DNA ligase-1
MVEDEAQRIPLRLYLFDILYVDGRTLIDAPYSERWDTLLQTVDKPLLSPRIVTSEPAEAERFLSDALRAGHEGLMAKALDSNYSPGARGKKWYKIKPFETLDLVVIAAEWGHGRRKGWLSNYHLGALDERAGEYLSLGKTFKGLTDGEFRSMTERLQALKIKEDGYTVYVKPSIVVEAAYNEIQRSPKYKSGFALRFARITRIREDKRPEDADTVSRVAELYRKQFRAKSRLNHDPAQGSL